MPRNPPIIIDTNIRGVGVDLNVDSYEGDGPIMKFELQYKRADGPLWDTVAVHSGEKSLKVLRELSSNVTYQVRAVLQRPGGTGGRGDPGPITNFTTTCSRKSANSFQCRL